MSKNSYSVLDTDVIDRGPVLDYKKTINNLKKKEESIILMPKPVKAHQKEDIAKIKKLIPRIVRRDDANLYDDFCEDCRCTNCECEYSSSSDSYVPQEYSDYTDSSSEEDF